MNGFYSHLLEFYKRLIHTLSFFTAIVALVLTVLAFVLVSIETSPNDVSGLSIYDYLKVKSPDTARSILSGILTGMISLTVFGFSMMMVVVNQSSSNFSPKVADTFINNRSNQYILGVYVGTIIFTIITLMQIDSDKVSQGVPNLSLITNVGLSVYCIFLFVRFINNISDSVRIGSIAEKIYKQTRKSLNKENKYHCTNENINTDNWKSYTANHSGYFQVVRIKQLLSILQKEDLILKIVPYPGYFFTNRTPLFLLNKEVKDKEVLDRIRINFVSYAGEDIKENEFYGFRQLREVAVKALSPGINDPGVARICIDYLGSLLSIIMSNGRKSIITDKNGHTRIILNSYDFPTLLGLCFTPIKAYGKKDYTVLNALLQTLLDLRLYDPDRKYREALEAQAKSVLEEADQNIFNSLERDFLNATVSDLNNTKYFSLPFINKSLNTEFSSH